MDIFVYKDELSSSQLRSAQRAMEDAESKLRTALSAASDTYGYEGRMIFGNQIGELRACLTEAAELSGKLEKYMALLDSAPAALIETDAKFNSTLSSGWERFLYGISGVLGLFSTGSVSGKTGSELDVCKTVESNAKSAKNDLVDDYRDKYGSEGKTSGDKMVVYSSKTTKTVSVFPDSSYQVTRYRDYKELSYSQETGDDFYNADSGLRMRGEHYEIESNDGTTITVDTNALDLNLKGSFDPAKGNAYVNAGAEYDLVKANVIDTESKYHSASMSFQAGIGAHANVGFHDGKFTVDVSAALGVGASVKLEFNYRETWMHLRSIFS